MWGNGPNFGMMGGWGHGGYGPIGMIIWLVILIALIAGAVWLFQRSQRQDRGQRPSDQPRSRGLDLLEERYARGEIDREEYLQKKRDLSS
jgi:putative membrane protein